MDVFGNAELESEINALIFHTLIKGVIFKDKKKDGELKRFGQSFGIR